MSGDEKAERSEKDGLGALYQPASPGHSLGSTCDQPQHSLDRPESPNYFKLINDIAQKHPLNARQLLVSRS